MQLTLLLVAAYLVGSVPFAVVVSRLFGMADPRSYGSGNPGATNVLRSGNKLAAALTLVGDAFKGWLAVFAAAQSGTGPGARRDRRPGRRPDGLPRASFPGLPGLQGRQGRRYRRRRADRSQRLAGPGNARRLAGGRLHAALFIPGGPLRGPRRTGPSPSRSGSTPTGPSPAARCRPC